ncbi:base excision DNA repair protein [Karstenula rhodostoma CBS 690.94]|uniref:Base excision DNA repair protein n=1 Tax=Karstenula rhodostoma CBS 690.94 TaxID=1392251 RepID=A0A9P4UFI3_9PLEO|nr:base excision DNA repair protein [Karstenula rhodostoma CBS 690.94]
MARVTRGSAAKEQAAQSPAIATEQNPQLSSPPDTPDKLPVKISKLVSTQKKASTAKALSITPNSARKRSRVRIKDEDDDINELPHNLGKFPQLSPSEENLDSEPPAKKSRTSVPKKIVTPKIESVQDVIDKATGIADSPAKKSKKTNNYGVVSGTTPYPDWPHPTHEECEEVTRLLSSVHGEVKAPEVVPPPSLEVTGCGEVPSVLDALIRTLLSAATTGTNSRRAFQGLVKRFGILEEGIGKGSVDWNKVRLADQKEVFEAIKSGGLADSKSKYMKGILQMVWEENQDRKAKLAASSESVAGSTNEPQEEKDAEISKAENNVLSLDHYHLLSTDEAFKELTKFPGIGAKTASCVTLFCLQRPSFAVDTHVFRLCQWLGWVPPPGHPALLPPGKKGKLGQPTRDRTYAHCEVRIPDHLKYPLHQLFIKHGKTCPRCRANTSETYGDWKKGCVIDHLVKRTGVRKGDDASPVKGADVMKARRQAKQKVWEHENESESSDLSDLGSDEEEATLSAEEDEDFV